MSRGREALVGLVIVGAIALTVVGTLWLQGASFVTAQRDLEAVFTQVGLLRPGNSMKFRGVEVGRVTEILVDPSGEVVRVRFSVDESLVIPPGSVVILSPESLFGDWQAEIHARETYAYADFAEPWEPGVLAGHALPDISQLTNTADRIAENLAVLTERFGVAFSEETAVNIASLIDNVEQVTQRLSDLVEQQAVSFTEVTSGVQRAVDGIADAAVRAETTFQSVTDLVTRPEVEATLADLAVISANVRQLSGELESTNVEIRTMAARADSTFMRAESILRRAEEEQGTIGRLLGDTEMAVDLHTMVNELRTLLVDVRENPRRYLRLSIF